MDKLILEICKGTVELSINSINVKREHLINWQLSSGSHLQHFLKSNFMKSLDSQDPDAAAAAAAPDKPSDALVYI